MTIEEENKETIQTDIINKKPPIKKEEIINKKPPLIITEGVVNIKPPKGIV